MTTARGFVEDALELLRAYSPGDTLLSADAARGFFALNQMIDGWGDEFLFVFQLIATPINLVNGKSVYTIGMVSGADVAAPRPARIAYGPDGATAVVASVSTPVNVVSAVEWSSTIAGGLQSASTPDTLYYDPTYPTGSINLSPIPTGPGVVTVQAWGAFSGFTNLDTPDVNFVAGVEDAIRFNLAVAIKSNFLDGATPPDLLAQARINKGRLQQTNMTSRAMLRRYSSAMSAPAPARVA